MFGGIYIPNNQHEAETFNPVFNQLPANAGPALGRLDLNVLQQGPLRLIITDVVWEVPSEPNPCPAVDIGDGTIVSSYLLSPEIWQSVSAA